MDMSEQNLLLQLRSDLRDLTKKFEEFSIRFARFEEQKNNNAEKLAEVKTTNVALSLRVDALEDALSWWRGVTYILGVLIIPIYGAIITVLVKVIWN